MNEIEKVLGFQMPANAKEPFLKFHRHLTVEPIPKYLVDWNSNLSRKGKWKDQHINGFLQHGQNSTSCVYYHLEKLTKLYNSAVNCLSPKALRTIPDGQSIGGSNTLRLDFEYQAFVLAVRRALDHITRGIAAFFEEQFNSFNELEKNLTKVKKHVEVAASLLKVHQASVERFSYVCTKGQNTSLRDLIAHYEAVSAGAFNINNRGIIIVGGGDSLLTQPESKTILEIAQDRAHHLTDWTAAMVKELAQLKFKT